MEPEVRENGKTAFKLKTKYIIIAAAAFSALMLSVACVFSYMLLTNDTVYTGVTVNGQDVSKLGKQELLAFLEEKYQVPSENLQITLKTDKHSLTARYQDLGARYDISAAAGEAFSVGRRGNIFERLLEITRAAVFGTNIDLPITYDEEKVDSFVDEFYKMTLVEVKESALHISDTGVEVFTGSHGEHINKNEAREAVIKYIETSSYGEIVPHVYVTPPTKFNIDDLFQQIISEPAEATFVVENSDVKVVPHRNGRQIEKQVLESIISELENKENVSRQLPVSFVTPEITTEKARELLFRDELATYTTYFSTDTTNGKNRAHNMAIAVSKINNLILAPGEEFSFNDVVGPRTAERGYKMAHVYSAGKIIDGIGGGICQVSSTMYNAVLKADLTVTERRNHSFTVGYVPLGQDATAFYDSVDFRFVNSTRWPIKILASVGKNSITVTLKGTNEYPNKEVVITYKVLKKTPFTEIVTEDPTKPVGYSEITVPGMTGYVVDTYKTVKIDGKVVSQTKLHSSSYRAYAQQVIKGTAPAGGATKPPAQAKPSEPPVDEAPVPEVPVDEAPPAEPGDLAPAAETAP